MRCSRCLRSGWFAKVSLVRDSARASVSWCVRARVVGWWTMLGAQHFSQSVTHTPSPCGARPSCTSIQMHVSDAAHALGPLVSQGPASLEHDAMGICLFKMGMHQLALVFHVDVHQLQQPLASHSSADIMSQENFGAGPGLGGAGVGPGGAGGGSMVQFGGAFEFFSVHTHMFEEQQLVLFGAESHILTDFEQFFAHDATLLHHPAFHGLPHHVQHGTLSHSAGEVMLQTGPGGGSAAGLGNASMPCGARGRAGTAATCAITTTSAAARSADAKGSILSSATV